MCETRKFLPLWHWINLNRLKIIAMLGFEGLVNNFEVLGAVYQIWVDRLQVFSHNLMEAGLLSLDSTCIGRRDWLLLKRNGGWYLCLHLIENVHLILRFLCMEKFFLNLIFIFSFIFLNSIDLDGKIVIWRNTNTLNVSHLFWLLLLHLEWKKGV